MTTSSPAGPFVVINPNSGHCSPEDVRRAIESHFQVAAEIFELVEGVDLAAAVKDAVARGRRPIIAAGGDGTVSAVADILAGTGVPLGILPLGTANVLARDLNLPLDLQAGCALLAGVTAERSVDTMCINGRSYLTQVGVGLDSLMIRDTTTVDKRRFGRVAYLWTAVARWAGFKRRTFTIGIDGKTLTIKGVQVVVANSGILGEPPYRWGPDVALDDGRVDVCLVDVWNAADTVRLIWHVARGQHKQNSHLKYWKAAREVTIDARPSLPVQADGEVVGETPVRIEVNAGALRVLVAGPA
ncbi:diacylglycerol kinase family lipid kinase [Isosphaeraceae bacterium EP7]